MDSFVDNCLYKSPCGIVWEGNCFVAKSSEAIYLQINRLLAFRASAFHFYDFDQSYLHSALQNTFLVAAHIINVLQNVVNPGTNSNVQEI